MRNTIAGAALVAAGLFFGPAAGGAEGSADKPAVREGQPKDIMAWLSRLEGDWALLDENGAETGVIVSRFRVTPSGGASMVMEGVFPDNPDGHESINMYQVEGERVILTHYCETANQPRAQVRLTDDENFLYLSFEGAAGKPLPDDDHTAEHIFHGEVRHGEYIFRGEDRLTTRWGSATDGELTDENSITLELKRKT